MVAEKFKIQLENYKKQQEEPQTVRGLNVQNITSENIQKKHQEQEHIKHVKRNVLYIILCTYLLFFTFLYKLVGFFREKIIQSGIFAQLILVFCSILGINKLLKIIEPVISVNRRPYILSMLKIFAYICLLIAFIQLNGIPFELLKLAD